MALSVPRAFLALLDAVLYRPIFSHTNWLMASSIALGGLLPKILSCVTPATSMAAPIRAIFGSGQQQRTVWNGHCEGVILTAPSRIRVGLLDVHGPSPRRSEWG